jgi:hypothetical protein
METIYARREPSTDWYLAKYAPSAKKNGRSNLQRPRGNKTVRAVYVVSEPAAPWNQEIDAELLPMERCMAKRQGGLTWKHKHSQSVLQTRQKSL